jgi:hypothetical protein
MPEWLARSLVWGAHGLIIKASPWPRLHRWGTVTKVRS